MRAVFFDLDGTLLSFGRPYDELLADAFRDVSCEPALERYREAFFERFAGLDDRPVERAFAATGADADPVAFAEALLDREAEAAEPPAGAEADLKRLADRAALGVLTNGLPDWQRRKLAAAGLAGYFDAVVASYEAGAHKPDPAPFRLAEDRLPAERYAMVGDADADVDGAVAAGWAAHRYQGGGFGDLPAAIDWDA